MATLPGYWQEEQRKRQKPISGQAVSPYSAPAEPTGGPAPMGGGSSPSAPKAAQGGGTGFVSFGQYFGANAPAVQAQAQKAVSGATDAQLATMQQGLPSQAPGFDQMLMGGTAQRMAPEEQARRQAERQAALAQQQAQTLESQRQAVQQQYDTRAQAMAEEPPESRKSRSRPAGSRFDDYFNE